MQSDAWVFFLEIVSIPNDLKTITRTFLRYSSNYTE